MKKRYREEQIIGFLHARLAPYAGCSRSYFAPRIPVKKLGAARGNYAADIKEGEIVALVDTTVFGGAKEGIVLTEGGMRVMELMSAAVDLPWTDIPSRDLRRTANEGIGKKRLVRRNRAGASLTTDRASTARNSEARSGTGK